MKRQILFLGLAVVGLGCDAVKPVGGMSHGGPPSGTDRFSAEVQGKVAASAKEVNTPEVAALFDRVAEAYRKAGSLELHGTVEYRHTKDGEEIASAHSIATFSLWYRAPDRYRLEVRTEHPDVPESTSSLGKERKQGDFIVAWTDPRDGKAHSYREDSLIKRKRDGDIYYIYTEASSKLGVYGQFLAQLVFSRPEQLQNSHPLPTLLGFTKRAVIETNVDLDGVPSTQVRGSFMGVNTITMWIHPANAMVRRYEIKMPSPDGSQTVTTVSCKGMLDKELPAETFEFTPPG